MLRKNNSTKDTEQLKLQTPEECYVEEEPELEDEVLFEMDEYKNTKWCECPNCHKKLSKKTLEQNEHECPYCGEIIFMDLLW